MSSLTAVADKASVKNGGTVKIDVLKRIEKLPSLSSVVAEFLELSRREYFTAKDFEQVLCKDQALVARLLKVANSGLYDTAESRYIALDDIRQLVMDGARFRVVDASGDDITRSILLQIIVEQEEKGQPMLSTRLLEQIILYYGGTLQSFVGTYLEKSMDAFIRQQQVLQDQMESMLEMAPSSVFRDMAERNLQLWKSMQDNLMKVYVPGGGTDQADSKKKD